MRRPAVRLVRRVRIVLAACIGVSGLVVDVIYGFAVESDSTYSYLFGWSYDQFNLPHPSSSPPSQLFVARCLAGGSIWSRSTGAAPAGASTVNFLADEIVANQAITPTRAASGADVCTFSTSPAFHIVDLVGWFV